MSTSVRMLTAVYAVLVATTPYKSLVSEKSGNSMGLNIARGTTDRVGCFCKIKSQEQTNSKLWVWLKYYKLQTIWKLLGDKGGGGTRRLLGNLLIVKTSWNSSDQDQWVERFGLAQLPDMASKSRIKAIINKVLALIRLWKSSLIRLEIQFVELQFL